MLNSIKNNELWTYYSKCVYFKIFDTLDGYQATPLKVKGKTTVVKPLLWNTSADEQSPTGQVSPYCQLFSNGWNKSSVHLVLKRVDLGYCLQFT